MSALRFYEAAEDVRQEDDRVCCDPSLAPVRRSVLHGLRLLDRGAHELPQLGVR
jgi:hypothetical protein